MCDSLEPWRLPGDRRRHGHREVELDHAIARTFDSASTSVLRVNRWTCVRSSSPRSVYRQRPPRRLRRSAQFATFGVVRTSRPSSLQERPHSGEEALRVAQVLDEIAAQDDVEGAVLERQLQLLDIADDHLFADVARRCGRCRIALDARRRCIRARRADARGIRSSSRRRGRAFRPRRARRRRM